MTHIMENIVYNELIIRECAVDLGIVFSHEKDNNGKMTSVSREIDFVSNNGGMKTYIQSSYACQPKRKQKPRTKRLH